LNHPDVHSPWQQWSENQTLHVAAAYSNPFRWRTRRELANDFKRHMRASPNVALHFGELAYGDRPHEVTGILPQPPADESEWGGMPKGRPAPYSLDVQLRTQDSPLFLKENILNAVIRTFPPNWQYGAIIDADFHMTRHDWALEAIHQLQFYDWVQLFTSYADTSALTLGQGMRPLRINPSFAYNYVQSGFHLPEGYGNGGWKAGAPVLDDYGQSIAPAQPGKKPLRGVGATGGAWAFRRSAFDAVGGLLDTCIAGHGDWHMTFGLVSEEAPDVGIASYSDGYRRSIAAWQRRAARLKKNIGYVDNFALHFWHGSKFRRFYTSRYKILIENNFDPQTDLVSDWQGIYSLSGEKPALRDGMRQYMIERDEDNPEIMEAAGERPLI
jgi:hypothetical protein